jgi:hypothetical protein
LSAGFAKVMVWVAALTVNVKVIVAVLYLVVSVGVKVAVIFEVPAATIVTVAPEIVAVPVVPEA